MFKRFAPALIALTLPALALAQDTGFQLQGLYLFHTDAQRDGAPVCMETWEFGPGDQMLVESGQERVRLTFRTETDRDGTWIVRRMLSTNGEPDCMGARTTEVPAEEGRTYIVPMNDGRILTCPPPGRTPDGAPYITGCYGAIVPADQAG